MRNELISVIVPVYKVEKYLDECVASIVGQTHKNLEIILVDDGSPDNCPAMCDEWAKKDERIRVIHKQNGGVSSARNEGLKQANGEFICFVDSDDYILPNYCELMLEALYKNNVDVVVCDLYYRGKKEYNIKKDKFFDLSNNAEFIDIYKNYQFLPPWNKMLKRALIHTGFPVGIRYGEDEIFNLNYFKNAKTAVAISEALYMYRDNVESVTHDKQETLLVERAKNTSIKYPLLKDILKDESKAKYCAIFMLIFKIQLYIYNLHQDKLPSKEIVSLMEKLFEDKNIQEALALYEYGYSKNNDYFCRLVVNKKYKKACRYIKFKYFVKKILHKI